ncbi:hypothetical protein, partial [Streptomyces scabiei]|uniref:hypothetical protein n=1 Tax=Streptomyces scabiei TaxID=1930 RepID=UPI0029CA6D3C
MDVEPGGDGTDIVVSEAVCGAQPQQAAYGGGAQGGEVVGAVGWWCGGHRRSGGFLGVVEVGARV